jgi:hypothetical protein
MEAVEENKSYYIFCTFGATAEFETIAAALQRFYKCLLRRRMNSIYDLAEYHAGFTFHS